ncbi:MAG: bifunctional phosphoribosylaminoimidazolecarboxamide formyltransferase/IMP cyclohydrolase [Clostridiales bacterium]|uniref:Bifunctional purine biosynthesis protein PurH n=2 Tax=Clostridium isatidis TaxID=182773 RepID=A0A343JG00_9CLOT|nr:bifunctional phosphoribosylaminoimidazolecarboxamide formyltransferase/IMP cyclohydrolase [Clostridium isatidis]ASW44458.1 bifunctional phosphoribosylaminoimidazolecarboxamide formyltransferase/IMP cyclohydrolase [Clostridium isatidis]NLZ34509.1 bifunctional phosphoribosylaminoimidazolecarboxamide formyltransferase/IMP cyclohydrolase [Clostridiales bacterium]
MMKRALISVYNKKNLFSFAKGLIDLGWEIISTGGTAKDLKAEGLKIIEIEEITKFPEILDGRVKTLNPYIHAGLLYKRDEEEHLETIKTLNINSIDMVVNNLYPFEETIKNPNSTQEEIIENIDIGGPSMIRAAAKNYKFVTAIVDPEDYEKVLDELNKKGDISLKTREYLACKVFSYTAYYDALISSYFNKLTKIKFPEKLTLALNRAQELRYGENPHQEAVLYKEVFDLPGSISSGKQLHGKQLSFNNFNDANGALEILKEFEEATVVAVKHTNPCGIGSGKNLIEAYKKAYECDKVSIFGGIIAVNREIDADVAEMINSIFIEVVMAPSFTEEALKILTQKKNIRLIQIDDINKNNYNALDYKKILGGLLVQDRNELLLKDEYKVVTKKQPTREEMEDLLFAWKAAKNIKSNGIIIAKDKATVGIGLGEVNRIWAAEKAIERGGYKVKGSVAASDGFFPFSDCVKALAEAGVTAIIQPGGSIRDEESIKEADKYGIAMVYTGIRHFKH